MSKIWKTVTISLISFMLINAVWDNSSQFVYSKADLSPFSFLSVHNSINIQNDTAFTTYGFPGNGTALDPYRIENLQITTMNETGISIFNTSKYFIIQNCNVSATTTGIEISNVASGTASIISNTCNFQTYGIRVFSSNGTSVINNTCQNNYRHGINFGFSSDCIAEDNSCINNGWIGAFLSGCYKSQIINNTCLGNEWGGVILDNCSYSVIKYNKCYENDYLGGLRIYGSPFSRIIENVFENNIPYSICSVYSPNAQVIRNSITGEFSGINILESQNNTIEDNLLTESPSGLFVKNSEDTNIKGNSFILSGLTTMENEVEVYSSYHLEDNFVNGKELGFFVNLDNYKIKEPRYGQLIIINCNQMEVLNQVIEQTTVGIQIERCEDLLIKNSKFLDNLKGGVRIVQSKYIDVLNNTISLNDFYGMLVENSSFCEISYNCFEKNYYWAIILDEETKNNLIHHNSFLKNNLWYGTSQAADDGKYNVWYDLDSEEGNYWSNYAGTGNYSIDGLANVYDLYPLTEPAVYISASHYGYFAFLSFVIVIPAVVIGLKKYRKRKEL